MPGSILNVPGGIIGVGNSMLQCTPNDPETSMLWQKMFCYEFRARNLQASEFGQSVNGGLWPSGNCMIGDPATFVCVDGNDSEGSSMGNMSYFEQWDVSLGNQSQKYILGQCKDVNGVAIGGAVIKCYVTSGDIEEAQTISDSNGNFQCPCPFYNNVAHYLVAYDASGLRAGTTVNTLIPTNRDGT